MRPPLEIVAGRYRLMSLLGQGGMGSVWRGEHTSLLTPVAVKLLEPRLAEKEAVRARFLREARAAASLRSKHVVQILDHGVDEGVPYIVMEMLRGESLGARLQREKKLEPRAFARIFAEIGRAIARAHKAGIVHRDLKPDNVFLAEPDEDTASEVGTSGPCVVKVVDFGIAKVLQDASLANDVATDTGAMIGTPHYMSPEQARGVKSIDERTDLWSMSVIAFECLTGDRPFRADALGELVLRICSEAPPVPSSIGPVPAGFDAWFARATQRKIEARFQTVAELVRSLEDILTPGSHHFEIQGRGAPGEDAPAANEPTPAPELATTVRAEASAPGAASGPGAASASGAVSATSGEPPTATEDPSMRSIVPLPARPRRTLLLAGGAIACAAVALAVGLSRRPEPAPAAASSVAPPAPTTGPATIAGSAPPPAATTQAAGSSSAAAQPEQPERIVLTVRSTPTGAELFRGADSLGKAGSPIELPWTAEPFEISVRKPGYLARSVTVTPAAKVELKVSLDPLPSSKETPF